MIGALLRSPVAAAYTEELHGGGVDKMLPQAVRPFAQASRA